MTTVSPLDPHFLEQSLNAGLNLLYNAQEFWAAATLALIINFFLVGLAYMVGEILRSPEINAWSKNEFFEAGISAFLVLGVFALLFATNAVVMDLTQGLDYFTLAENGLTHQIDRLKSAYDTLFIYDIMIGTGASLGTSFFLPFGGGPVHLSSLGAGVSPLAGLGSINNMTVMLTDTIMMVLITLWAQWVLMDFARTEIMRLFFPMGILFRAFPISRRLGSTIIAFSVAAFLVFPLSVLLAGEMYRQGEDAICQSVGAAQCFDMGQDFEGDEFAFSTKPFSEPMIGFLHPLDFLVQGDTEYLVFKVRTSSPTTTPSQEDITINGNYTVEYYPSNDTNAPHVNITLLCSSDCISIPLIRECPEPGEYRNMMQVECKINTTLVANDTYNVTVTYQGFNGINPATKQIDWSWNATSAIWNVTVLDEVTARQATEATARASQSTSKTMGMARLATVGFILAGAQATRNPWLMIVGGIGAAMTGVASPNYIVGMAYDLVTCDQNANPATSSCNMNDVYSFFFGKPFTQQHPNWNVPVISIRAMFSIVLTVMEIIISITFFRSFSAAIGGETQIAGLAKII